MKKLLLLCLIASNLSAMFYPILWHDDFEEIRATHHAAKRKGLFYEEAEKRLSNKKNLDEPVIPGESLTALRYFAGEDASMFKRLLAAGATPSGKILKKLAMEPNQCALQCAKELLRYKVNVNGTGKGRTPLHWLVDEDNEDSATALCFAHLLLSNGANPNLFDSYGTTPLYDLISDEVDADTIDQKNARLCHRKQFIHELIFHGAHLKTKKDDARTPLELAKEDKNPDLIYLAEYTERQYYSCMLQLCWIKNRVKDGAVRGLPQEPNLIQTLPRSLLKLIADRTV